MYRFFFVLRDFFKIQNGFKTKIKMKLNIDKSTTKKQTNDPKWDETFIHEVENASTLGITIFHQALPSDVFVANCTIPFDDVSERQDQEQQDFWVSLIIFSYYFNIKTSCYK